MLENSNREAVRELARETMKTHKMRNIFAVLAIGLTTLLLTTICTIGISFYDTLDRGTDVTPAPMADGGVVAPVSVYGEVAKMPQVEWAVYARPCNVGSLHNKEMTGIKASLLAVTSEYYDRNEVETVEGSFPSGADEIMISDTMAERLAPDGRVGENLTVYPVVRENGKLVEKAVTVKIAGICTSPAKALAPVYEELYVTEEFLSEKTASMQEEPATIYVKTTEKSHSDAISVLLEIREKVNASGIVYRNANPVGWMAVLAGAVLVVIIMFSGYLLIYNVFYISIVNDIRFYGMLKTVGTTSKQIRYLLTWQVTRLTAVGIVLGTAAGCLAGPWAAAFVISQTQYQAFYKVPPLLPVFAAAVLFTGLTVVISCRKSYRLAGKISPVEAARFREHRGGMKKALTVISFALSGIIFLTAFTLPFGYDIEQMVKRYHTADVRIQQTAMLWGSDEEYQPIEESMIRELKELPFIDEISLYYQARDESMNDYQLSPSAAGQIRPTELMEREFERMEALGSGLLRRAENGDIILDIWGMPADELHREEANIRVVEGALDEEKFASGQYLIYNQNKTAGAGGVIHAGQKMHLSIRNPVTGQYTEKDMEVLAVVERLNPFPTGLLVSATLALPDAVFQEIYPQYDDLVSVVQIDGTHELSEEEYAAVEKVIQESFNSQLSTGSRYQERKDRISDKTTMTLIGIFLSAVFGLIGGCNVVNTLVTDALSRKIEFAAMQSIGMTKRQLWLMLTADALKLCVFSLVIAIPAGAAVSRAAAKAVLSLSGFSAGVFGTACIVLAAAMCALSMGTAAVMTHTLNQKSVVERLRETE